MPTNIIMEIFCIHLLIDCKNIYFTGKQKQKNNLQ